MYVSLHNKIIDLTLETLGKIFSRQHNEIFFLFSQNTSFDSLRKLSRMETICMKCQILFYRKNKKKNIKLSSVVLAKRVVNVQNVNAFTLERQQS